MIEIKKKKSTTEMNVFVELTKRPDMSEDRTVGLKMSNINGQAKMQKNF